MILEELVLSLTERDADLAHDNVVHVAHPDERNLVHAVCTHHLPTPPTVVLGRRGREKGGREEREGGEGGRREREEKEGGKRGREEREGGERGRRGREEKEGGERGREEKEGGERGRERE